MSSDWLEREVVRVRDRVHTLAGELAALRQLDANTRAELLRREREYAALEKRLHTLEGVVDQMGHKDEIADAVAAKLQSLDTAAAGARFTRWQTWGIRVAILATLGTGVGELAHLVSAWAGG